MAIKRKYYHDHLILLLNSVNIFLGIIGIGLLIVRLISQNHASYFIQYRPILGLNAFQTGSAINLIAFIFFIFFIVISNSVLSFRVYLINRHFAIVILLLGILLLIEALLVSNALLGLH